MYTYFTLCLQIGLAIYFYFTQYPNHIHKQQKNAIVICKHVRTLEDTAIVVQIINKFIKYKQLEFKSHYYGIHKKNPILCACAFDCHLWINTQLKITSAIITKPIFRRMKE